MKCNLKDCPVFDKGICMEGFDQKSIEDCPNSFEENSDEPVDSLGDSHSNFTAELEFNTEDIDDLIEQEVNINQGLELTSSDLRKLSYNKRLNVILLMGEPNSGKTTLIASIYDQFQKRGINNLLFKGSMSLIGYEKRCFLSRWNAINFDDPDTIRTSTYDEHYLHLNLFDSKTKVSRDLMFSDVSGEYYSEIRDLNKTAESFTSLLNSTHSFYVIDGAGLLGQKRHSIKNNAIRFIERIINLPKFQRLKEMNIVITRKDAFEDIEKLKAFFIEPLESKFPNIDFIYFPVASRVTKTSNEQVKEGDGIPEIVNKCFDLSSRVSYYVKTDKENDEQRMFIKYKSGWRRK